MKTYEEEYLALMAVADAPIFETSTFEIAHACLRILDHSMFALSMRRANYLITLSSSYLKKIPKDLQDLTDYRHSSERRMTEARIICSAINDHFFNQEQDQKEKFRKQFEMEEDIRRSWR